MHVERGVCVSLDLHKYAEEVQMTLHSVYIHTYMTHTGLVHHYTPTEAKITPSVRSTLLNKALPERLKQVIILKATVCVEYSQPTHCSHTTFCMCLVWDDVFCARLYIRCIPTQMKLTLDNEALHNNI